MIFKLERENEKCYLKMGELEILVSREAKTLDECIKTLVTNFVLNGKFEESFKKYEFVISKMEKHNDFLSLFSDLYKRENPLFDCYIGENTFYSKPIYVYFNHYSIDTKLFTVLLNIETALSYGTIKPEEIIIEAVAEKFAKSLIEDKKAQRQIVDYLVNCNEWKELFSVRKLECFIA